MMIVPAWSMAAERVRQQPSERELSQRILSYSTNVGRHMRQISASAFSPYSELTIIHRTPLAAPNKISNPWVCASSWTQIYISAISSEKNTAYRSTARTRNQDDQRLSLKQDNMQITLREFYTRRWECGSLSLWIHHSLANWRGLYFIAGAKDPLPYI